MQRLLKYYVLPFLTILGIWSRTQLTFIKSLLCPSTFYVWSHLILTVVLWIWYWYTQFANLEMEVLQGYAT